MAKHGTLKLRSRLPLLAVAILLLMEASLPSEHASSFANAGWKPALHKAVPRMFPSQGAETSSGTSAAATLVASFACGLLVCSARPTVSRRASEASKSDNVKDLLLNNKATADKAEAAQAVAAKAEAAKAQAAQAEAAKAEAAKAQAAQAEAAQAEAAKAEAAKAEAAKAEAAKAEDAQAEAAQAEAAKAEAAKAEAAKAEATKAEAGKAKAAKAKQLSAEVAKEAAESVAKKATSLRSDEQIPPSQIAEIRREIDAALARIEELEIEGEVREKKLRETEKMASQVVKNEFQTLQERENVRAELAASQQQRDEALAKVKALEQALAKVETRAKGLEQALTAVGSSVGAALKNTDLVEGEASLYDTALNESETSRQLAEQLEQEKVETLEEVGELRGELSETKERLTLLQGVEARVEKLSEGVKKIFKKIGADKRRGIFSFFGQSDDRMIEDTLEQIEDMTDKKGSRQGKLF